MDEGGCKGMKLTKEQLDIRALKLGILMNFPSFTGEEKAKEAVKIVEGLENTIEAQQQEIQQLRAQVVNSISLPTIKSGKTLYWVWDGKIVRVRYGGIGWGCMVKGKFHIVCEKSLLYDVTLESGYTVPKGDKRYFYADELDKVGTFTTRKQALSFLEVGDSK
jgi:hypothetical protein